MSDAAWAPAAALRRFPYPYRALLAICSDLDLTPDAATYLAAMRFLNTSSTTPMGEGVGLEVGNSIYFDMPPPQFSYWGTDDRGRAMVRSLIRSGHIDCLHSFGDLAATRDDAGRALDELVRHDCRMTVWIDHAVAPSNFGADRMRGSGDVEGSAMFHADLTCAYGIEYVWLGRVTSITAQNAPRRLTGIFVPSHPIASLTTLGKEWAKGVVARAGRPQYAMHATNDVLRPIHLRSGHPVHEFLRANPHWGGVSCNETADGLPQVLTAAFLDRLEARAGVCVLYTHLGKTSEPARPFPAGACAALRLVAERVRAGRVMVTTTRRLLDYCRFSSAATVDAVDDGHGMSIAVSAAAAAPAQLAGLTLYVDDPDRCHLTINGRECLQFTRNAADQTGRRSVSIPWTPLEFPQL